MVGVSIDTLKAFTAVSRQTAGEMARGGALAARADACLSVTGYAGPPSGPEDRVGLVYVGCFYRDAVQVKELHLQGGRRQIREASVEEALGLLELALASNPD